MELLTESIFPDTPVVYATFGQRFWAFFVDEFFVFVSCYMINLFIGATVIAGYIDLAILFFYNPIMEASPRQATIGKSAMNIKVTTLDGGRIHFGQAIGRHFGKALSTAFVFIGYFMMLWNVRHQALHDIPPGTLVVQQ